MAKSALFIKGTSIPHVRVFDSVTVGLGNTCGVLLGKIANWCEMDGGVCLKSQDDLAFSMGNSIKTIERSLSSLVKENLITDYTNVVGVPHKYSLNEKKIREFDKKYVWARDSFLILEQKIIESSTEELRKKYVVENKNKTKKILRRYVNFYYKDKEWHIKITHIVSIDMMISSENLNNFVKSFEGELVSGDRYRKLKSSHIKKMKSEIFGEEE